MYESTTARISADETVCFAVVDAVSAVTVTDPLDLEPLAAVVDTDALDTLFGSLADRAAECNVHLSFRYAGCDVTIEPDGLVSAVRTPGVAERVPERPSDGAADATADTPDVADAAVHDSTGTDYW